MNIKSYRDVKEKKLVTVSRIGPNFTIIKRRFDPDTGIELSPEAEIFKREDIEKQRAEHQTFVDELTTLLADLDALP
jgi:hypothetical protein